LANQFRVLDLFAGIGGWSLGLERTGGFRTVAFVESDEYCRAVLRKHWPDVPQWEDVQTVGEDLPEADVITAGWPCQDLSVAGKGEGLKGERSGLWSEVTRIAGLVRPKYILLENVATLLNRGLGDVLGDLAEVGYNAEWHCIPAASVGAPHGRDRIWIVAHPSSGWGQDHKLRPGGNKSWICSQALAHPDSFRDAQWGKRPGRGQLIDESSPGLWGKWAPEPGVDRVVDGFPGRVDRIRSLGNALVPQIPEMIGYAILEAEANGG